MPVERNVALARRVVEEFINGGNLDLADELLAPDFVNHNPSWSFAPDRAGLKRAIAETRRAFPDVHYQIEDLIAHDDRVVFRYSAEGMHLGSFAGVPPTGRRGKLSGFTLMRIRDNQVVERWSVQDNLETLQIPGATITLPGAK